MDYGENYQEQKYEKDKKHALQILRKKLLFLKIIYEAFSIYFLIQIDKISTATIPSLRSKIWEYYLDGTAIL